MVRSRWLLTVGGGRWPLEVDNSCQYRHSHWRVHFYYYPSPLLCRDSLKHNPSFTNLISPAFLERELSILIIKETSEIFSWDLRSRDVIIVESDESHAIKKSIITLWRKFFKEQSLTWKSGKFAKIMIVDSNHISIQDCSTLMKYSSCSAPYFCFSSSKPGAETVSAMEPPCLPARTTWFQDTDSPLNKV